MSEASRLRSRWNSEPDRVKAITADLLAGRDWTINLISRLDGKQALIAEIETCTRQIIPGEAAPRDLRGFRFQILDLSYSTALADCSLDYATFENVQLYGASLTGASLRHTTFKDGSSLAHATMRHCDCRRASLASVALTNADLRGSDLRGTDLCRADLHNVKLADVHLNEEPWWALFFRRDRWTRFGGKFQSANYLGNDVDAVVKRRIVAEADFYLFRCEHPILGLIWYIAANGGRSAVRLGAWALFMWFLFAIAYHAPMSATLASTPLIHISATLRPEFVRSGTVGSLTFGDSLYFSAVTLTTLGYGDIVPAPSSWTAKCLVAVEALLGYVLLGMFVALLLQTVYIST